MAGLDIEFKIVVKTQNFVSLLYCLTHIRLFFFLMQQSHIDELIFQINTFLEQCI